jgi:preprotein translocase subunit SecG
MITIAAWVLLVAGFVSVMALLVVMVRATQHRIDIPPGAGFQSGKSKIWQVNVFTPSNYDAAGRTLVRWMWILQVAWIVFALLAIYLVSLSDG